MKIFSLELLAKICAELRERGQRIVLAHGVFDIPHVGHTIHLQEAKKLGDVLVVTVTPDEFVNKGEGRPLFKAEWRAIALAGLACVDYVAINKYKTAWEVLRSLRPCIYVKGKDTNIHEQGYVNEIQACMEYGIKTAFTSGQEFHSTKILEVLNAR